MDDHGSPELERIARALYANFTAVVEELQRHADIVSAEFADARVRDLERHLAEARAEAYAAEQMAWDTYQELRRLRDGHSN